MGEVRQRRLILRRPGAGLVADRAERPELVTVRINEGDAQVRDDPKFRHGAVIGDTQIRARIFYHERSGARYDVLAEGVRERRIAPRRPGFRQASLTFKELPIRIDQRYERDGRPEKLGCDARYAVENLFR